MSTFFDELEAQLRDAAQTRVAQRRRHRRWLSARVSSGSRLGLHMPTGPWLGRGLRGGLRAAPVMLAAAVTVAVAVGALVLLHHSPHPAPAPPASTPQVRALDAKLHQLLGSQVPPHMAQELTYIQHASVRAGRTAACRTSRSAPTSMLDGSPGRPLLGTLGILRRPASPSEHVNIKQLGVSPGGYYSRYARRVRLGRGSSAYILAQRSNPAAGQPGPGCLVANRAALRHMLPGIPRALRAPTLALETRLLGYGRRLIGRPPYDGVCFALVGPSGSTGESCGLTVSAIRHGAAFQTSKSVVAGLVPDGVASVMLRYPAAAGRPAHTFAGPVHGNVYAIHVGGRYVNALRGSVWRSSTGRVLHSVPVPRADESQRYCRAHEIRCIALIGAIQESSGGAGGVRAASESATTASGTASGKAAPSR